MPHLERKLGDLDHLQISLHYISNLIRRFLPTLTLNLPYTRNGGIANFTHCRFIGNGKAQIISYIKASIEVTGCEIVGGNDSGILVMENARAMISNTKITGTKIAGVAVQVKAVVDIRDCDISNCGYHGLLIQTGKSTVTVVNCHLSRNQYGVSITVDCLGTVTMEGDPPCLYD